MKKGVHFILVGLNFYHFPVKDRLSDVMRLFVMFSFSSEEEDTC